MSCLIKNGRVIDPANKIDTVLDIFVSNSKIEKLEKNLDAKGALEVIDAKGKIVAPALIDMHVHLREPGREDEETIATGSRAAIRGGYASLACMPNTVPAIDSPEAVKKLAQIIKKDALCNVFVIGAITEGRLGKALTDFKGMKSDLLVAVSDDGASVEDRRIIMEALELSKKNALLLIEHCEDVSLSAQGVMNAGFVATKMGLRGIPGQSEYERARTLLSLAKKASSRIHIAHVSAGATVDLIRKAKRDGVEVTCETAPHYFALTEGACVTYDTNTKMNPPLRTKEDVEAIKAGLADGTIDAIATDHAPHTDSEKDVEFDYAPFGIIGLESALSISIMELVEKEVLSWSELIRKMSANPASILGVDRGSLKVEAKADIVIIDPDKEYTFSKNSIESKSKNTPFIDWRLKGKVTHLFVGGKPLMRDEMIAP